MLSKPGEARSKAPPSARRINRKAVEENLEDVVRKLQRLPANKVCADCSSKLPQCVDLNHGTFICMPCSGVHREFNHKIKVIGHSSFTPDEVAQLRLADGNDHVNARYLAKYNGNIGSIRRGLKPTDNSDLNALRSWIQCKYVDRVWFQDTSHHSEQPPKEAPQTAPPGRRKVLVDSVSKKSQQTTTAGDLNSFANFDETNSNAWDAFGQADFGIAVSQPTMVSLPPETPSFQAAFGNMQQQHSQPSFETNFDQTQQKNDQNIVFTANFDQSGVQNQQSMFHANFDQAPSTYANQPSNLQTHTIPMMNQGMKHFRNFDQIEISTVAQNSFGGQQQQHAVNVQSSTNGRLNKGIDSFGNFDANFDQISCPTRQNDVGGMSFGNFAQQQPELNAEPQQKNALQQGAVPHFSNQQTTPTEDNTVNQNPNVSTDASMTNQPTAPSSSAPSNSIAATRTPHENNPSTALNPNAFRSVQHDKKSAFDAFEGLSLEPTPGLMESSGPGNGVATASDSTLALPVLGASSGLGMSYSANEPSNEASVKLVKLQETAMMIQFLSLEQLLQVQQYIISLCSAESGVAATTQSGGMSMNGNGMMGCIPKCQKGDIGQVGMQNTPASHLDIPMANGGGMNFNGQPSMPQFQQYPIPGMAQMQMAEMGSNMRRMNDTLPSNLDVPLANGSGMNMNFISQSSMQPTPMAQMHMTGMGSVVQNSFMPEPVTANSSVSSAALPPVEKEGNPFDMY